MSYPLMDRKLNRRVRADRSTSHATQPFESLEQRCLLSGVMGPFGMGMNSFFRLGGYSGEVGTFIGAQTGQAITFNLAPTGVQTALDNLAMADGLAAPTAAQSVNLSNVNGVETYSIVISGTGTQTKLTVDAGGNAVTAPTRSTTTFGAISNTAVTNELNTIATGLGLTPPVSTTPVAVLTAGSTSTYTLSLTDGTTKHTRWAPISVDSNGNPVGDANLPFSTLPAAVQTGLTNSAPAGSTLGWNGEVSVRTLNGVTTYSATYVSTGLRTTVTVNSQGTLTSLPSNSASTFGAIPSLANATLQALATSKGVTTAIDATQKVYVYTESPTLTIYSIRVPVTVTASNGSTFTYNLTLSADQNGNATVLPNGDGRLMLLGGLCVA